MQYFRSYIIVLRSITIKILNTLTNKKTPVKYPLVYLSLYINLEKASTKLK